jgi:hypothetical protein
MTEAKFSSFVISETTRNQIKALPQEMQLKFFWAVTEFGLDGIDPNFDGIELALWIPMRDFILSSKRKDEAWHNKQQENGKKGGRPRKKPAHNVETQNNPKNPELFEETQKTQRFLDKNPKTHNDNDNDNDNEDVNVYSGSDEPLGQKPSSKQKQKKPPLREREPVNDLECVEKAYLQNWDALFTQGKVKTADPVVNWNQTRKLLKNHFERIKPDLIIQAINNGITDDWVLEKGYSLGTMLSASVLNRLINSKNAGPPGESKFGKLSEGTVDISALYKQFGLTGSETEKRRKLIELRDRGEVSF